MPRYDYSMLRGRIRELFKSEKNFAMELRKSDISMSTGTFCSRMNGYSFFKQPEIAIICKLLKIKMEEISLYFFTSKYEFNSYNK